MIIKIDFEWVPYCKWFYLWSGRLSRGNPYCWPYVTFWTVNRGHVEGKASQKLHLPQALKFLPFSSQFSMIYIHMTYIKNEWNDHFIFYINIIDRVIALCMVYCASGHMWSFTPPLYPIPCTLPWESIYYSY